MTYRFRHTLYIIVGLGALLATGGAYAKLNHCKDVACARQKDEWFKARYDDAIPLYLTRDNYQPVVALMKTPEMREVAVPFLSKLPSAPAAVHAATCAVVGNSGNLSGSHYGAEIDAHQYVFRMNNAPLEGYETDVGQRTTYHVLHTNLDWVRLYSPETLTIFAYDAWGVDPDTMPKSNFEVATVHRMIRWLGDKLGKGTFPPSAQKGGKAMEIEDFKGGLYLLHPDFLSQIASRWFTPEDRDRKDYASIGFKTLVLAFHLCDSIDVYGFGANTEKNRWDHYFDKGKPMASWPGLHRAGYQDEFLATLEKHGIIRLHYGNTTQHHPYESHAAH